jgi:hypothetical protein
MVVFKHSCLHILKCDVPFEHQELVKFYYSKPKKSGLQLEKSLLNQGILTEGEGSV